MYLYNFFLWKLRKTIVKKVDLGFLANWFLRCIGIYVLKINWLGLDDASNSFVLHSKKRVVTSVLPNTGIDTVVYQREIFLSLYLFENVIANTRANAFYSSKLKDVFIEGVDGVDRSVYDFSQGFILKHNSVNALVSRKKNYLHFDSPVLFLGGFGSFNFYHFLIEICPKLLELDAEDLLKLNINTILIDLSSREVANFKFIIKSILRFKCIDIELKFVDSNCDLICDKLYFLSTVNNTVFNVVDNFQSYKNSYFDYISLKSLREIFIFNSSLMGYPKKIFLSRRNFPSRAYNFQEVESFYIDKGFTIIYPEDYNFAEQVLYFASADTIVGPSGAAWSNLIFCSKGTKALSWLPSEHPEFSTFSTLAYLFSVDLRFCLYHTHSNDIHSDYSLDLKDLSRNSEFLFHT